MPSGLRRFQQARQMHFVTFSCYRRLPKLATARARSVFEHSLEQVRRAYGFCVAGFGGPGPTQTGKSTFSLASFSAKRRTIEIEGVLPRQRPYRNFRARSLRDCVTARLCRQFGSHNSLPEKNLALKSFHWTNLEPIASTKTLKTRNLSSRIPPGGAQLGDEARANIGSNRSTFRRRLRRPTRSTEPRSVLSLRGSP